MVGIRLAPSWKSGARLAWGRPFGESPPCGRQCAGEIENTSAAALQKGPGDVHLRSRLRLSFELTGRAGALRARTFERTGLDQRAAAFGARDEGWQTWGVLGPHGGHDGL